jgi:aryl-alcohol dehydrogenase-like predicted oxidoreductase
MTDSQPGRPTPLDQHPPLSRLGLGAWAFGRTGWGTQHDHDSRAAILRAIDLGINWIDTAAVYGDGHSEKLIGSALSELLEHERPLVFTKGGVQVDPSSGATFRDLRPRAVRADCERSLQRLRIERIDLYQLHWPVEDTKAVEQAWQTLGELQQDGKIRWAGVSNFELSMVQRCAARHPVDAMQVPLSLLSRDAGRDLLPWAAESGVCALAYSPLESGLLSGRFSAQRVRSLPKSDWRRRRREFQEPQLGRTLDLVARLEQIAAGLGASPAELAIAWTLAWRGVGGVIVGARTPEQVDGWADASRLALENSVIEEIECALEQTGAGAGPTRPPERHGPP